MGVGAKAGCRPQAKRPWRRRLAIAIVCLALLWLTSSFVAAWRLTHRRYPITAAPPAPTDFPVQTIRIKTDDSETLGGWLSRGKRNRPAVLLLHGMRGSRADHVPLMRRLHRDGYTVLAVTLRGHGDSTGERIDFGYSSPHDVVAAVDRLSAKSSSAAHRSAARRRCSPATSSTVASAATCSNRRTRIFKAPHGTVSAAACRPCSTRRRMRACACGDNCFCR